MSFLMLPFQYSILLATIICSCFVQCATSTTTLLPISSQCNECKPLELFIPSQNIFTTVKSKEEINGTTGCTQIITCNASATASGGFIRMTILKDVGPAYSTYSSSFKLEVNCKNGKWYPHYNSQQPLPSNIYHCDYVFYPITPQWNLSATALTGASSFLRTTTPLMGYTRTTTTPGYQAFTTTTTPTPKSTTPKTPTVSIDCKNTGGLFQRLTSNANTSIAEMRKGNFVGFFKSMAGCQKLCNKNWKEKCYAYMYEPKNRGSCTIFSYTLYNSITEDFNSTAMIYKKCEKAMRMPIGSGNCCAPLMQSHVGYSEGIMTFTYNNNTCRSTTVVTCSPPQGLKDIQTGILVNEVNYVEFGPNTTKYNGTCYNGIWQMAHPIFNVTSIGCTTTDPL